MPGPEETAETPIDLTVPTRFSGLRLSRFLISHFPRLGPTSAQRLIRSGKVEVNGETVWQDAALHTNARVTVHLRESKTDPLGVNIELTVLHEDPQLIVINKPVGEVVVPARNEKRCRLLEALVSHLGEDKESEIGPRVVHRLDRDTTGALVFAKTLEAQRWLSSQFSDNLILKKYLAVVEGTVYEEEGSIDLKIRPAKRRSTEMKTSETVGRDALTEYRVAERFRGYTLLEVYPKTGRTHQVRVHLSAIGHPLAIDPMYGTVSEISLSQMKRNYRPSKTRPEAPVIDRLTLHAQSLKFHPSSESEPLEIEAPLPVDFERFLRCLRKYRKASRSGAEGW